MLQAESLTSPQPPLKDVVMAKRIGLAILAHVMRQSSSPIDESVSYERLSGSIMDILSDLQAKGEWLLGRKFILHIATAAQLDKEVALIFVSRVLGSDYGLSQLRWEWVFQAILALGAMARVAPTQEIRSIALEKGLLRLVKYKEEEIGPTSRGAQVRCAAVIALGEAYLDIRGSGNPSSVLVIEVLAERIKLEESDIVRDYLGIAESYNLNSARTSPTKGGARLLPPSLKKMMSETGTKMRRTSFIFKYISMELAEKHIDALNRHRYLEKYVKQSKKNQRNSLNMKAEIDKDMETLRGMLHTPHSQRRKGKNGTTTATSGTRSIKSLNLEFMKKDVFVQPRQNPIPLESLDYHSNYLYYSSLESIDSPPTNIPHEGDLGKRVEPLKVSLMSIHRYNAPSQTRPSTLPSRPTSVHKPARGTVNRRKLVDVNLQRVKEDLSRNRGLPRIAK